MKKIYDIDDNTQINLHFSWGKTTLEYQGEKLIDKQRLKANQVVSKTLKDGRELSLKLDSTGWASDFELRIDGKLQLPTDKDSIKICSKCQTKNKPNDSFCVKCGTQLPSSEAIFVTKAVNGARKVLLFLSVIFVFSGIAMYYMQQPTINTALRELAQYNDSDLYPEKIEGVELTVGELRKQILANQYLELGLNLFLATLMIGLFFWAKNAPLPALIIATSIYVVLIVANAIYEPATIGKGIVIKIIVIGLLIRGIKSALSLRQFNNANPT